MHSKLQGNEAHHGAKLLLLVSMLFLLAIPKSLIIVKDFLYTCIYIYIYMYRSRCHGNVHLNNDSKLQRSIPIALRAIINPVDVRGGQSARDDKSHTHTWWVECA